MANVQANQASREHAPNERAAVVVVIFFHRILRWRSTRGLGALRVASKVDCLFVIVCFCCAPRKQTQVVNFSPKVGGFFFFFSKVVLIFFFASCRSPSATTQMRTFLFSLLGTFCPYKYSAWKATIREQVRLWLLSLYLVFVAQNSSKQAVPKPRGPLEKGVFSTTSDPNEKKKKKHRNERPCFQRGPRSGFYFISFFLNMAPSSRDVHFRAVNKAAPKIVREHRS